MKLEQNDVSMMFSNTEIADVFFTEYLSSASGNAIKVYLYILFLSKYGKDIKLNDLSKKLSLPLKEIQDSIKYWEDIGVITKKVAGYIVNNIQEIELHKLYKPRISVLADTKKSEENQYRSKAIEAINVSFFQGVMSPSWYNDIDLWFKKYGFDEQVMIALFRYCFERSALHRNYIQVVADAWFKNNIKTFSDLDLYYQKEEPLTQYEEAYIEKWTVDFGYSLDIIELALKRTTSKSSFSFDYIDKILSDWNERHLKTINDVQKFLDEQKNKPHAIKDLEKKSYQNYEQRKVDNLDSLYANVQKA